MTAASSRDERRRVALDAAAALLEDEGVGALSMRRLARASKMAVNTLYAMFSTRDGILQALVDRAVAQRMKALGERVDAGGSPCARLESLIEASVQHSTAHPATMKPMYRAAAELRAVRRSASQTGLTFFAHELASAIDAGELRAGSHPELLASTLMLVVHECSLAWALDEISDAVLLARCRHVLALTLAAAAAPAHAPVLQARLDAASAALAAAQ